MTIPVDPSHEGEISERERATIDRLAADLTPVRPLWSPSARLGLWLGLEILVFLVIASTGFHGGVREMLDQPAFLLEFALLIVTGAATAAMALRAAVPGGEPRRWELATTIGLLLASAGVVWMGTNDGAAGAGFWCARQTAFLAFVPWVALLVATWRGATLVPAVAGGLAGTAAFLIAAAVMRMVCPADSFLHIAVWHFGPAAAGLAASASLGWLWLGAWRR